MPRMPFLKFSVMMCAALFAGTSCFTPALAQEITAFGIPADDTARTEDPSDGPLFKVLAPRSNGRLMADALRNNVRSGGLVGPSISVGRQDVAKNQQNANGNGDVQVNNPALDHVVSFPNLTRPFEFSTQSETSVAANGRHIVVGYNSSANAEVKLFPQGLFFTKVLFTAFSVSHDGGGTWTSGFVPPPAGSNFTFGDPALAVDRRGNFFYASLGADAQGNVVIMINKSNDNGRTFGTATVVATDNGGDKEWLAVGPRPNDHESDNLYVTWTSFLADSNGNTIGSALMFARSTDGGASWTSKQLFAPTDDALTSSAFIQFSNPVVDPSSGRLYIPFLHFSSTLDADAIKVLVSDDGGDTFRFLKFNVPGWPDPTGFPNVTPGELADCGRANGGIRNVLHQGVDVGGGRFGLARYVHATRLVTQPAAAASNGHLLIAFQSSTSPFLGDPAAGSEIKLLFSANGGHSWAQPVTVAGSTRAAPQHVHPAITLDESGEGASIAYYTQQGDSRLRTDIATVQIADNRVEPQGSTHLSSVSFDFTPSNIPHPLATNPFFTTNYDRTIVACYDIGEYMSVARSLEGTVAAWGDNRNTWVGPADSAAPGPHPQPDVFFTRAEGQQ